MNVNFEAAIHLINLGSYDTAAEHLRKAIAEEKANGNEQTAIEYTCVLGDLFSNLGEDDKAKTEFDKVLEYCDRTKSLNKQRKIAADFMSTFSEKYKDNTTQVSPYEQ